MCGLSGVMSSSLSWQEEDMFRDLLNVSSLRGHEGAGVIVSQNPIMKKHPNIRSLRTSKIAGELAYSSEFKTLLNPRVNAIIGHARWPTKGGVDIKAVHPHRCEHIIGVHNGTMNRVGGESVKDRSDSQMLFESFAKNGVIETIKESDGAYALVWIDEQDQTINFLRNGLRTLYFKNIGWNKNINTLYWSSERDMLDFVFKRTFKGDNTWDTYMPVNTWFKYPLDVKHIIAPREVIHDVQPTAKVYPVGEWRGSGGNKGRYSPRVERRWNYTTGRFETIEDELPWTRLDGSTAGAADTEHKVIALPGPVSKQEQKRRAKILAKEARDEEKRAERFARAQAASKKDLKDISSSMSEMIGDDVDDVGVENAPAYLKCAGKECAWCGTPANAGERVVVVNGDIGDHTFICHDCSSNSDCQEFTTGCRQAIVSP